MSQHRWIRVALVTALLLAARVAQSQSAADKDGGGDPPNDPDSGAPSPDADAGAPSTDSDATAPNEEPDAGSNIERGSTRRASSHGETPPTQEADAGSTVVDESEEYGATAHVEAPPHEATRRTVEKDELTQVPGTRGDALRAVEVLPGVARPPSGYGNPILRGAAASDSQTFLEGVPVPFLYHFGGVTSFFNSALVERLDLYPGNFSARYGRLSGGVVEVTARDPRPDGLHAMADLNFIDSSALVEAPVGQDSGFAVAARRSNIDFFFKNFVPKNAYAITAAPVYYDFQLLGIHRMGKHTLRLLGYGSRDSIELFFAEPSDADPGLTGKVGGLIEFERVALSLTSELSPTASQELSVTLGNQTLEQHVGVLSQRLTGPEVFGRAEWGVEVWPELRLTAGLDFTGSFSKGRYRAPLPGVLEGDPHQNDPLADQTIISAASNHINVVRPGAYVELAIRPVPSVTLIPALRADYYADFHGYSLDPRLSTRAEITPNTTLKSAVGIYSQPPEYWQVLDIVGNPHLQALHSLHTSAGVEQKLWAATTLGVEGFYKWLWDRPVLTPNGAPPRYVNDGVGRIYGVELSVETRPTSGTVGYLAYTLSRSERRDGDQSWRRFDFDETHVLSVAISQDLGRGWSTGARFRLVSGAPYTPIVGSVYDARTDTYVPIYGSTNSAENPAFRQLDLRLEKAWHLGRLTLAAYLDLQNAYNAKNVEALRYSYDYRESQQVTGLPILPNLGVRGEL